MAIEMLMPNAKQLNPEQLAAATHADGPLLIVAGAGTGKTTVLIERLSFLISEKLAKPEEILLLTFTEKAAGEMEERADRLLPYGYVDLWIATFHGFCERILRDHALDIGLPADFKLLNQTEQWVLIRKNLDAFDLDYYRPLGNPTKFIHELIRHFSRLKDEDIAPAEYLEYAEELESNLDGKLGGGEPKANNEKNPDEEGGSSEGSRLEAGRWRELADAYHLYNRLLLENGFLDFGDLINYTIKLFRERPNILEHCRRRFKYVMVDEFQDTNWAQYELIKILAAPKNNLAVVGDDDQAIYKFRGASLSNIMQFKDDFPEAEEIVLTKNYRSRQAILDASHDFIAHNNPNRLEVKLGIEKKLIAGKEPLLNPLLGDGENGEVEHLSFQAERDELAGIREKIVALYKQDKEIRWSDFAILVRANDTADKFVVELSRAGIPNQFVSLRGLYTKPIILDALAFLKLLDNYHESSALFRALNMEVFKVEHGDIININKFARLKAWSMFEALEHIAAVSGVSAAGKANIEKFLGLVRKYSALAQREKPSRLFTGFIVDSGLIAGLDHNRNAVIFDYLNQFYQRIRKFEENEPGLRLKDLMRMFELEFEAGDTGGLKLDFEDDDRVKIMTVHAAKGLEFKYVFIPCLVDKKFPVIDRKEKIPVPDALVREKLPEGDVHIEEERRLFYVAMTRAKEKLFLTSAADYGGEREKKPSRFIEEAGLSLGPSPSSERGVGARHNLLKDLVDSRENGGFGDEERENIRFALPEKFSFSQLEAFAHCPLQYKYAFILKIPVSEKVNFIFGRVMHNTLKAFLEPLVRPAGGQASLFGDRPAPDRLPFAELENIFKKNWIDDGYRSRDEREKYKKKGAEIIKMFYAGLEAGWPQPAFLEKTFLLKIGDVLLRGAIDRIDRLPDGTVEIIDYKTGNPKDKLEADDKRQLIIYQLAIEQAFGLKASRLSYYYLENGQKISFAAKEKELAAVQEKIVEQAAEIRKCAFPPKPGFLCAYCDFNSICEFRKP